MQCTDELLLSIRILIVISSHNHLTFAITALYAHPDTIHGTMGLCLKLVNRILIFLIIRKNNEGDYTIMFTLDCW